jgi:hypothetical protein
MLQATQFDAAGAMIQFPKMDEIAVFVNGLGPAGAASRPGRSAAPADPQRQLLHLS